MTTLSGGTPGVHVSRDPRGPPRVPPDSHAIARIETTRSHHLGFRQSRLRLHRGAPLGGGGAGANGELGRRCCRRGDGGCFLPGGLRSPRLVGPMEPPAPRGGAQAGGSPPTPPHPIPRELPGNPAAGPKDGGPSGGFGAPVAT